MAGESPVVTLVNAILLSAIKKGASAVRVRRDGDRALVELAIDGVSHEEMEPQAVLHPPLIRRLSVMASLPMYGKGQAAEGFIQLQIGMGRIAYFAIRVEGHGDEAVALLRSITAEEMPAT